MENQYQTIDYYITSQQRVALDNEPMQTIDLQGLFTYDAGKSGVFDLSDITSTSLGKLLNALPVPVLLVDQWFCIAFVNQACEKLRVNSKALNGARFTDLLPNPHDATRGKTLESKTMVLLERVFSDRRPQRAEAILEIGKHRIWARLHLRSVGLGSDRHIMVIVEDVTSERTQQRVSQKEEARLREALGDLEKQVQQLIGELSETEEKLRQETDRHEETKGQIKACIENRANNK